MNNLVLNSPRPYLLSKSPLTPNDFRAWSSNHLYRTSTSDMHSASPPKNKNYAIPGYTGIIPGVASDNTFGKSFTKTSREQLSPEVYLPSRNIEVFPKKPAMKLLMKRTVGKFGGGLEDEYHTVSRFHGKSTLSKEHPNYINNIWTTVTREVYTPQELQRKQIFRTTNVEKWKKIPANLSDNCKSSGFINNRLICDGEGWLPIKQLHGDMKKTEYRNKFTNDIPFHPSPLKPNERKSKKALMIVKLID